MKTNINWLLTSLLAGFLATAGCGGGGSGGGGTSDLVAPNLTLYNSSVEFGDVAVGATTTLGVTFSNTGGSSLTLQQNSVSGAGFATSGIGAGVTLAPGQFVTLAISFNPSGSGKANGMVSLTSSNSNSPINLPVSGNGVVASHSAGLNWDASASGVVGYNIYRNSASDASWTRLNSSPVVTTSYTDWDVQSGGFYLYSVKSVSSSNSESTFSKTASVTIPSP